MKKFLSLLFAVITAVCVISAAGINAFAEDAEIKPIELNTKYEEAFEKTDDYDKKSKKFYDYFEFTVPADGKVTLYIISDYKGYTSKYARYYILNQNADKSWSPDNKKFKGKWSTNLKKGKYYFVAEYKKTSDKAGEMLGGTYTLKLAYKPTIDKVQLKKVAAKNAAFKANWKRAKGAAGYIVEYSNYKNFKKSETVEIKGGKTLSATVKELQNKKNYYVRVKGFRNIKTNGKVKTYYGKWSKTIKVKTK